MRGDYPGSELCEISGLAFLCGRFCFALGLGSDYQIGCAMKVIILAAGYATRLYPLTLTKAKPLLEVAGKPMIEWVLDNLAPIPDIGTVYVVTNDKFADDFQAWANGYAKSQPKVTFKIVNDGSRSDADKLGAIGDIRLV